MRAPSLAAFIALAGVAMLVLRRSSEWKQLPNAKPYLARLAAAESKYALPRDLLARMAYQESHWREDIVSGKLKSSAGALGLMQIVPSQHPTVNALDVSAAIDYAGKYLQQLYREFNSWPIAVAAYNAGPGNVRKYKGIPPFDETRKYVREVFADI